MGYVRGGYAWLQVPSEEGVCPGRGYLMEVYQGVGVSKPDPSLKPHQCLPTST